MRPVVTKGTLTRGNTICMGFVSHRLKDISLLNLEKIAL